MTASNNTDSVLVRQGPKWIGVKEYFFEKVLNLELRDWKGTRQVLKNESYYNFGARTESCTDSPLSFCILSR